MAKFQNNKKKDWFSHETRLVFMHGNVFKDGSRNSATFKVYNNGQLYLHVAAVTQPSLQGKLKSDENGHVLKVASDILFCRHVFTFFWKCQFLSVSLTFCFIPKINYKNENWYH